MSDQVSQEFNTQFAGGGGGAGITSINGDVTPAQLIVASAGITVGNAGATHSIGNAGVLSVAKQGSPSRTGAIVLKPSATVSIVEAPNGTYEFDAIGAAGIVSINGDVTPAQVLAAGASISITPGPAGTNTIAFTGAGAGLTSINGDGTPAQVIAGINGIDIVDVGATHNISPPGQHNFLGSAAGGAAVPNGALTVLAAAAPIPAGGGGTYFVGFGGGVNGIAGQKLDVGVRVNGVLSPLGNFTGILESAGQTLAVSGSIAFVILVPGDVVDVFVNHHGGGAATTSLASGVWGIKFSN